MPANEKVATTIYGVEVRAEVNRNGHVLLSHGGSALDFQFFTWREAGNLIESLLDAVLQAREREEA